MPDPSKKRYSYAYGDINGNVYTLETTVGRAAAGAMPSPAPGTPALPNRFKPRRLYGTANSGAKAYIVPATHDVLTSIFNAGSFDLYGDSYRVTGFREESFSRPRVPEL